MAGTTEQGDFLRMGMRLIELRLKVAALQRAETLVVEALKEPGPIYSIPCDPDRYAPLFRKIDAALKGLEARGSSAEESMRQLASAARCLEHDASELVADWLGVRRETRTVDE